MFNFAYAYNKVTRGRLFLWICDKESLRIECKGKENCGIWISLEQLVYFKLFGFVVYKFYELLLDS